jgi:hypothetical protein
VDTNKIPYPRVSNDLHFNNILEKRGDNGINANILPIKFLD